MTEFFRFPRTPHLTWIAPGKPRGDKLLSPHEARELLAHEVVVEEKVDGANVGFSVGDQGEVLAQNRGSYIDLVDAHGQFRPLARWLAPRRHDLADALAPHLILFGEWCYAVHSVRYTRLPDWFLAFDVYDRERAEFWSVDRRDALARKLGLSIVPELARGRFTLDELEKSLGASRLTDGPAEGIYVRREQAGKLVARAKLVRAEFVQAIDEHWSKRPLEVNALASGAHH